MMKSTKKGISLMGTTGRNIWFTCKARNDRQVTKKLYWNILHPTFEM